MRIALNLKGLAAEHLSVHLSKNGGEQFGAGFDAVNPQHLLPQLYNARRFECDLSGYPTLLAIEARCAQLAAFRDAEPGVQPDAQ